MSGPDFGIVVVYDNSVDSVKFYTNLRDDKLEEVLGEFLHSQVGKGEDKREPERKPVYTIKIGLWLADDYFQMEHDCGNDSLATGIVMRALRDAGKQPPGTLGEFVS